MKRLCGVLCWVVLLTVVAPLGYRATRGLLRYDGGPKADALASQRGAIYFFTSGRPAIRWPLKATVWGRSLTRRLAACHKQGGVGGSGPQEHNVTVFTRAPKPGAGATRGVIHQFAVDAASQETLQNIAAQFPKKSRPTLADIEAVLPKPAKPTAGVQTISVAATPEIDIGQRNTPALFGASVIDAIPDAAILANERNQGPKLGLAVLTGEQLPAGVLRGCHASESENSVGRRTSEIYPSSCESRAPTSWGSAIRYRPSRRRCRSQSIVPAGSISPTSSAIR